MSKNAEISVNRAEIVEKERKRLVELGAERGVRPEDVVVHERGGLTILFAARANGEALVVNYAGKDGPVRYRNGIRFVHTHLEFKAKNLITAVYQDGSVSRGGSTVARIMLERWYRSDVHQYYEETLLGVIEDLNLDRPNHLLEEGALQDG